jgi:anti-sigma regulatory factor (Ser/Thr protein kinase)
MSESPGAGRHVSITRHPTDFPYRPLQEGARAGAVPGLEDLHVEIPTGAGAPQAARAAVLDWAEDMPIEPARRESLRLLVSELVSNAVMHSGAAPEDPIRLAASVVGGEVLVTVTDPGGASLPRLRTPDPIAGGYGLHLVKREARRWGVERADGTRVWFCL